MILADKIIDLRKKNGWSQEELAAKLNVSRQAVSKWEGAQSVPELDRVLQMSRLFGVSTDYLLKDELTAADSTGDGLPDSAVRTVSMEEANRFLAASEANARPMALAIFLCIISPVCLLLLAALSSRPGAAISEGVAAGIGLCVLLLLVAAAVAIFISCDARVKPFAYMEMEIFETAYGVESLVSQRKAMFEPTAVRNRIIATVLCILGVLPLLLSSLLEMDELLIFAMVCVLLLTVGVAVVLFVLVGVRMDCYDRLLQQGDYSRDKKNNHTAQRIAAIYWPLVIAAYLAYSFITNDWQRSWIIWPVAGVLFGGISAACSVLGKRDDNKTD